MTAETVGADVAARLSEAGERVAVRLFQDFGINLAADNPTIRSIVTAVIAEHTVDHAAALRAAHASGYILGYGKGCEHTARLAALAAESGAET